MHLSAEVYVAEVLDQVETQTIEFLLRHPTRRVHLRIKLRQKIPKEMVQEVLQRLEEELNMKATYYKVFGLIVLKDEF